MSLSRRASAHVLFLAVLASTFALVSPARAAAVTHDQYNQRADSGTIVQDLQAEFDAYDSEGADDFVVPSGVTWTPNTLLLGGRYEGNEPKTPTGMDISIYRDAGERPGQLVHSWANLQPAGGWSNPDLTLELTGAPTLEAGRYWLGVQVTLGAGYHWMWVNRTTQLGLPAMFRNPGNGWETGCTDWGVRSGACAFPAGAPDQVWALRVTEAAPETPSSNCTIVGTPDPETLNGTTGNDVICGLGGNDTINGGEGDDLVIAGTGDDIVDGGLGNDILRGGDGVDQLTGSAGNDDIAGELGNDLISGGDGNDSVTGDAGHDAISLDAGTDFGNGSAGNDVVNGGNDKDRIFGALGRDTLNGQDGDDVVAGGPQNDTITGGTGDDDLIGEEDDDKLDGGPGLNILIGEGGADTLRNGVAYYGSASDGVTVNLRDGYADGQGHDTLRGVRAVVGSRFRDKIFGSESDDDVLGGGGNDAILGYGGSDAIKGGAGDDNLSPGDGLDVVFGDAGADRFNTRDGAPDKVTGGDGRDVALVDRRDDVTGVEDVDRS